MSTNNAHECFHEEIKVSLLFWLIIKSTLCRFTCIKRSIALDKALFSTKKCQYLSYISTKMYVVGTH